MGNGREDIIQGYVDGINERLLEVEADPASLLPFEFVALGLTPEPWTVNQILAWSVVHATKFRLRSI